MTQYDVIGPATLLQGEARPEPPECGTGGTETLRSRPLVVQGAFEFAPRIFPDHRGQFLSPFQEPGFVATVGHRLFPVAQTNHSVSRRGVLRGVHFTMTPPGSARYVHCAYGKALDIVVDIRLGSPTFGRWDAVILDPVDFRTIYCPIGVGHAFVALEDETQLGYLISSKYVAEQELTLSAFDPALGLPIPGDPEIVMSERDRLAPSLVEAERQGILPSYARCLELEREMFA